MSLNFCDLLVLGSDLSGVMTATLLAKRGLNVLVLDDEEEAEPLPNIVTGLGSRAFKSLLGKLMIPDTRLQILHENKVGCQVVFPRHRMDLPPSRALFFKEIEREFPEEKTVLEELLTEIDTLRENCLEELLSFFPVSSPREKKRFIKWFQGFPAEKAMTLWNRLSPVLQAFIRAELKFHSQSLVMDPPILQLLLFLPPEEGATFSIRGGLRELKRLFFNKIDYFGGMVHPLSADPFRILTKGREVRAVQLSRYNFPTRCRFLLGNMNIQSLYRKLSIPFFPYFYLNTTKKKILGLEATETRGFVQYHTSREILPAPMKENVVYVSDPSAPLEGGNYLEINLSPLSKAAEGELDTLLTVTYRIRPGSAAPEILPKTLEEEIDSKLRHLIPFANNHFRKVFPVPPETKQDPGLFPEETGSIGAEISERGIRYSPSFFFPTPASPFKNLFVVGPNILDWLGMEGKMLSALRAVELIWARELKIRNP